MKSIPVLLTSVMLGFVLTACPDSSVREPPPTQAAPPDPAPKAELEKKIAVEQQLRQQAEARLEQQQSTTSYWQNFALFAVASAVILLVVGTALGAQARHDADSSQP